MADRLIERVNADVETLELDAWLFSIADGSISTSVNLSHTFSQYLTVLQVKSTHLFYKFR